MTVDSTSPILVASCGNPDAGADAFGPQVAASLRRLQPWGLRIIDLDMRPAALLDDLKGVESLVLVDALHAPGERVGRLIDTDWFDPARPPLAHDDPMSTHGLSIHHQLALAQQLGMLPRRVWLIGCTIHTDAASSSAGASPDPRVARQVSAAVHRILLHRDRWLSPRRPEARRA